MKNIKLVALALIIIFTVGCESNNLKEVTNIESKEVTLKVKIEKSVGGLLIDYDVYADDKKIGQI